MKNSIIVFFISITLFTTTIATAQVDTTKQKVNKKYFASLATDFVPLIISPIKWNRNEWISATAILGTAAILYSQDRQIAEFWQKNQTNSLDNFNKYFFDPLGKMYYTIPLMGATYIYGAIANKNKPKRIAMDFFQASLYSGIIVTAIKVTAHRHRPYQTDPLNPYLWDGPFSNGFHRTSFPSGHTIMTFTFAAVIANHYKETVWVPIVMYGLATLEGASRMYANKHWSSDVFIGGALGYAIGTFVVNRNNWKVQTTPIISQNFKGILFTYPF